MPLKILGDRVLVRADDAPEMERGVYLPESAQEKPQRGAVVGVGEGRLLKDGGLAPVEVAEGDRVMFARFGGTEVTVDGEDLVIMAASDILAVLADEE